MKKAYGSAAIIATTHTIPIIRIARLKPDIVWEYNGWQIAKYRSMLNETMVNTDAYDVLKA